MGALATAVRTRRDHHLRLEQARHTTDELFRILNDDAFYERPIAERHRVIFYLGHLETFDWNLLGERAFGLKRFNRSFDQLFAFGIDPVGGGLPTDTPADWPTRREIAAYNQQLRDALDRGIEEALGHPQEGHPQLLAMLDTAIEHRLMHAETLAYMFHRLPFDKKRREPVEAAWRGGPRVAHLLVDIPAGFATLGMADNNDFAWDNERGLNRVFVPEFSIENHNVTNRQFMHFVQHGGYHERALWSAEGWKWREENAVEYPAFWNRRGNVWTYRGMFSEHPLPMDQPVYVSHAEASAYAKWLGRKLPTEEQFHRAAYGVPNSSEERSYPWGEDAPDSRFGNFNFANWDPEPCGSHPEGASAFGVQDLVGNGWEWTRTVFAPFRGFAAMPFYPGYSANFFDGKHYVMKGGSPRTAACMLRRSFRNWFQPHYPYVYATFRCVEE
ncbi:MAG TPA: SUMF1/EgtB/PvdO family nonheme iron enzyme [Dongiaceae bacterium]|nr:SUMF1/EgtB/PvdO family nonheme iron enzyme [Dongiaceae bacterium]